MIFMAQQKTALVTGANRGLGLEIARQLAHQGYEVFLGMRDLARGAAALSALKAQGLKAHALQLDMADSDSIKRAVAELATRVPALDALVNNAGVMLDGWSLPPSELPTQLLRDTFETNLIGPFELLREASPLLRKSQAARVVNIATDMSSLANINNPQSLVYGVLSPAYQSSKVALNAMTVLFAKEFMEEGIKVNSASPGWCRTDMGTDQAPLSVEEGADTAVWLATLPADGPTGQFFSSTRKRGAMEW
jgi:NAD(P)-dependent dehydrogenase (short-subunit alcohol dehydrogenase family)